MKITSSSRVRSMRGAFALLALVTLTTGPLMGCGGAEKRVTRAPSTGGDGLELAADYTWAVELGPQALEAAGYEVTSRTQNSATSAVFIGASGASMNSWGHKARLLVDDRGDGNVSVRIITSRNVRMNVTEPVSRMSTAVLQFYRVSADAAG